jgi:plasmid stabilization system protein ParE
VGKAQVKVDLTRSALGDLENIIRYYEDRGVPKVGRSLSSEIFRKIERLKRYPDSGRVVPEFDTENLREVVFPPFRIVYRRGAGRLWVIRIWRSERLMKNPKNLDGGAIGPEGFTC